MAMNIDPSSLGPVGPGSIGSSAGVPKPVQGADGKPFKDFLTEKMKEVNEMIAQKDLAIEDLATGKTENIAEVFTAIQKADVAFKYMMQIRSKLLDAYQELNRMQL